MFLDHIVQREAPSLEGNRGKQRWNQRQRKLTDWEMLTDVCSRQIEVCVCLIRPAEKGLHDSQEAYLGQILLLAWKLSIRSHRLSSV